MQLTVELLKKWFVQFNADYFDAELPEPRFVLSYSKTRLGSMSCKRRLGWRGVKNYNYTIRVSMYYDCTEADLKNVLLHEMIHECIAHRGVRDVSSHGPVFRRIMNDLNTKHGWNIRVRTSAKGWKTTVEPKRRERLVLAVVLNSGKRFLSVVNPRYYHDIDRQLSRMGEIISVAWFVTDDDFFRDYAVVRSLRGRCVSDVMFEEKTKEMTPFSPHE